MQDIFEHVHKKAAGIAGRILAVAQI